MFFSGNRCVNAALKPLPRSANAPNVTDFTICSNAIAKWSRTYNQSSLLSDGVWATRSVTRFPSMSTVFTLRTLPRSSPCEQASDTGTANALKTREHHTDVPVRNLSHQWQPCLCIPTITHQLLEPGKAAVEVHSTQHTACPYHASGSTKCEAATLIRRGSAGCPLNFNVRVIVHVN